MTVVKDTARAIQNLKSNLQLLTLIKDTKEPVMDAIEFGWMHTNDLLALARDHEKVDQFDKEQMHDLIRELGNRLDEYKYMYDDLNK
jgi:hypothetical protein